MRRELISLDDLSSDDIFSLFELCDEMSLYPGRRHSNCTGKIIGLLFFQESTRTRLGFATAASRIGMIPLNFGPVELSRASVRFQESLEDTLSVVGSLVDGVIIRHYREDAPSLGTVHSGVPVINAGNGRAGHPSQALSDLYLLSKEFPSLTDVKIALAGEPNNRVFRSFVQGALKIGVTRFAFLPPIGIEVPFDIVKAIKASNAEVETMSSIDELILWGDVLMMMPIDLVDMSRPPDNCDAKHPIIPEWFALTPEKINKFNPNIRLMHPGPRGPELGISLDPYLHNLVKMQLKSSDRMRTAVLRRIFDDA